MVSTLYSVINIVCLFLFTMVLIKEKRSQRKNEEKFNSFYVLNWILLIFTVMDCYWGLVASKVIKTSQYTFYILTILSWSFSISLSYAWLINVDFELNGKIVKSKPLFIVLTIPLIVAIGLVVTNRLTGLCLLQDSFFVFRRGPAWIVVEAFELFYYLLAFMECIYAFTKDKNRINARKIKAFFGFCLLPMTAFFFQIFYLSIPCKCIGYMLSSVLIYIFNSTEENLKLSIELIESNNFKKIAINERILDAIADSYDCLYLFSTKGGNPLIIRNIPKIEAIANSVNDPKNIFSEVVRKTTHPDYLEKMFLFTNLASLEERLENKKIISIEFKGVDGEWGRASWIRVEEDEEGLLDKVLYAVSDISEEKNKELNIQQKLKTALENQNEIYAEILQMQSNGIVVTDMHDNVLTVNETALKLFGIDDHVTLDNSLIDIMTNHLKDKKDAIMKKLHTIKVRGGYFTYEFIIEREHYENIYIIAESKLAKTSLGQKILITSFTDITKNKKVENDLVQLSETDSLTKINNRGSGARKIEFLLGKEKGGMLCIFDADKFKSINDNYGHIAGDKVLVAIADCMNRVFRDKDVIMRLGGDEFAIYAVGVTDENSGRLCIERFFDEISKVKIKEIGNNPIHISVGAVFCTEFQTSSFDDYYQKADKAMYRSKRYSGPHYEFY